MVAVEDLAIMEMVARGVKAEWWRGSGVVGREREEGDEWDGGLGKGKNRSPKGNM